MFYERLDKKSVRCRLCPHVCRIGHDYRGKCGVRENRAGTLFTLNYGRAISAAIDPIEKKPLYHFLPCTFTYSIAAAGCNLFCEFCQNWEISQQPKPKNPIVGQRLPPKQAVQKAISSKSRSISYTYTEPTIFFEYAYETAKLAKQNGLKNIFVTNGYTTKEAIDKISTYLDAANVDLKGFSDDYYKKVCGGRFQPVIDAIRQYHDNGVFLEITTLLVPGHNDDAKMIRAMARFIRSLDNNIPWHISRFYPQYNMQGIPAADMSAVYKAVEIGKTMGLNHVYAGSVPGQDFQSTFCPKCRHKVIRRTGSIFESSGLKDGRCPSCGMKINIVGGETNGP